MNGMTVNLEGAVDDSAGKAGVSLAMAEVCVERVCVSARTIITYSQGSLHQH